MDGKRCFPNEFNGKWQSTIQKQASVYGANINSSVEKTEAVLAETAAVLGLER